MFCIALAICSCATFLFVCLSCVVQLLDLPGIIEGAKDGKGRGRQVIAVARTCGLIFIILDVLKPTGAQEDHREGVGGIWDSVEQDTAQH